MAALDFPDSPAIGDTYGSAGVLWRWDGNRWATGSGGGSGFTFTQEAAPIGAFHGATWHDTSTGLSYVYVVDVNSSQWVQFSPGTAAPASSGLHSARPPTPPAGFRYFSTDIKRESLYDGTGWVIMSEPLMTYTPTWANVNLGTGGTNIGEYHRSDGWLDLRITMTLGTGGSFTGQPNVSLPNATSGTIRYQFGVRLLDSGVNNYRGLTEAAPPGALTLTPYTIYAAAAGTATEAANNISATGPFTWAAGDGMDIFGRYRLNDRYA